MKTQIKKSIFLSFILLLVLLLNGCGGGGSSSTDTSVNKTGIFIDNVVSGVMYINNGKSGYTDSNGSFPYTGGTAEFFVGNIKIGEIDSLPDDGNLFVQDIVGVDRTNTSNTTVLLIATLLQSLDSDSLTDEIELIKEDCDKFNSTNDDITNLDLNTLLPSLGFTVKSQAEVLSHLLKVLIDYGIISDTIAPVLSSTTQTFTTTVGTTLFLQIVTATDNVDSSVSVSQSGSVSVDFNTIGTYTVTYIGMDSSSNFSTITHTYIVSAVPDTSAPVFVSSSSQSVDENQTSAFILVATDNSTVTYSISGTDASSFNINETTGVLTFKIAPDYESKTSYSFTASASDTSSNSTTQDVTININNLSDSVPSLINSVGSIAENSTSGTSVGTILITNTGGSSITAITLSGNGNENFIVSNSGEITLASGASLDYETNPHYSLTAIATNSAGYSSSVTLIVLVTNIADDVPILANFTGTIAENASSGDLVGSIAIADSGDSAISSITLSGSGNENFIVDISGNITLSNSSLLDYETTTSYSLTAVATNSSGNSSSVSVTININNIVEIEIISHDSFLYNIITSPITGKKWLDRNLGATEVCTESRDSGNFASDTEYVTSQEACFGDYYQWGRLTDGHEKSDSSTIYTLATNITSAGVSFITNTSGPYDWVETTTEDSNNVDDDGSLRIAQWSKIDGFSICPIGFRVPTSTELYTETTQYSGIDDESTGAVAVTNRDTAFKNFLKFPASGYRSLNGGYLRYQGYDGVVWSSSVNGTTSGILDFNASNAVEDWYNRANGFAVRCVKD